ncbi:MAG: FAD-dependent oxidoreductase, partial [Patescibacteria group bacterium]
MIYDVIIVGGGPAGTAAAVYTARKKLKTLLITESFGGQSIVSDDIQNWIGEPHISGFDLAKKFEEHVRLFPDMVAVILDKAIEVKAAKCLNGSRICDFEVRTEQESYEGKTVILASGARRRKLGVPGEE